MGEAVKNLPQDFKKTHKDVEWKDIAATRDKLIHEYFGVNYPILWNVIQEKLPALRSRIADPSAEENR